MSTKHKQTRTQRMSHVSAITLMFALFAGSMVSCGDQPKPGCLTTTAPFAMKLIKMGPLRESTPGACTRVAPPSPGGPADDPFKNGPVSFNADPEVRVISYYEKDSKNQPNYDKGSVAIQTAEIGALAFTGPGGVDANVATDGKRYSFGAFSGTGPDADDFCMVPTLEPTHLMLTAVPDDPMTMEDETAPPVDMKLVWSNVKVYVTPASYATQIQADLEDTRVAPNGDVCTINYRAVAMAPAVPCGVPDADGAPMKNADGTFQTDEEQCNPLANPAMGRFLGSGISPNTNFICSPQSAFCVLDSDVVPALIP